ncbi:hypothetical protein Csa_009125 [Cucumis sativus]|uniref:Uncharacterized protein n=1 Tax=Cucumis sativus TaxID=3659 RepID=A0A0A0KNC5_CUCSA|nr:hypothetical protein Csa_009125 [Cucumis sativus]
MGPYKSFSIIATLESLDWLKTTFNTLLKMPRTTRFFLKKGFGDYCLWVQKTHNRKGYLAEFFRVDDKGRKCCILVIEGRDKQGWAQFTEVLSLRKEAPQKRSPQTNPSVRGPKAYSYSSSTDFDNPRHTYVEVLTKGSLSNSDSPNSYNADTKEKKKEDTTARKFETFDWSKTEVITKRCFHDDWKKIMEKLQEQLDHLNITYKLFHAEKAMVFLEEKNMVNLLCKNRGWTTIGKFYVKFEAWNISKHATPKVLSSYVGWVKFKGIPLHAWNYSSFYQIGEVCGGFVEVARITRDTEWVMKKATISQYRPLSKLKENGSRKETQKSMALSLVKQQKTLMNSNQIVNSISLLKM